jgi:hypothetical protein
MNKTMQLYNQTQKKLIAGGVFVASSIFAKSLGLIGQNKITPLYLKTRWGIHTFGVRHTITVLLCNDNLQVKAIKSLKPNRVFLYNPRYQHIFELPSQDYPVTITDMLSLNL